MTRTAIPALAISLVAALIWLGMARAQERKDREFQECRECPIMIGIPSGTFLMGSPANESGRFDSEAPQHEVSLKAFALGKYDVASEQFLTFLKETGYRPEPCNPILNMGWSPRGGGHNGSPYQGDLPRWPAVCLDWQDAEKYVDWLNAKVGREHPAAARTTGPYRLPTEAEWEYAARGGTKTARWWGDAIGSGNANCNGCGSQWDNRLFADVDSFAPNPFGLYGMLGNAWQWTADCWHPNYVGAPRDGSAWSEPGCSTHVIRGGSWHNLPVFVRSAARVGTGRDVGEPDYSGLAGFRIARDLP